MTPSNQPASGQPYLTYGDLHARYSPHSPPLRMPQAQRTLSVNDLLQRFRQQGIHGQNPLTEPVSSPPPAVSLADQRRGMQDQNKGQNPPASAVPSPPPTVPPDHEALRPKSSKQATRLSTKLPDPPVFSGTNDHVQFDDWKLRIQDKLTYNGDHYPSDSFKVAYITTRLSGEARSFITFVRRHKALSNDNLSSEELLDLLSGLNNLLISRRSHQASSGSGRKRRRAPASSNTPMPGSQIWEVLGAQSRGAAQTSANLPWSQIYMVPPPKYGYLDRISMV